MEKYDQVIKIIKAMPRVEPGSELTAIIMKNISRINAIPSERIGIWRSLWQLPGRLFITSPTKEECAISFISMGLFYLIFDLLLIVFTKKIQVSSEMHDWIMLQSPVLILVALLLISAGSAVWFMGRQAVRFARFGLVIYILLFILSGAVISTTGEFASLLGMGLLVAAILTGLSLNSSMGKYACHAKITKG
jgi:hypothetical protein